MKTFGLPLLLLLAVAPLFAVAQDVDPAVIFRNPPESAKPGVLWMWMGSNITKEGITKDLEALKRAGFNRTTMFHLSDITTSLSAEIANRPGPELISWTEPWWAMVRFAAEETRRLGMEFGMHNCPGYETSGGPWITPELSMQDLCWSEQLVTGGREIAMALKKPEVDPRTSHRDIPFIDRATGKAEIPVIPERRTYYRDVAVVAAPAGAGALTPGSVITLTGKMEADGTLHWNVPEGEWIIYRFGHTTTGARTFPAQWQATGFECDKMNPDAVAFHIDHVIDQINKHLGDLIGTGFTYVHFDSYEAGIPTWTPKMPQEFKQRRGYDLTPFLPVFAGRKIGTTEDSVKFRKDFSQTIKDLYRDSYFPVLSKKLAAAGLTYLCEPYGGPWDPVEIMPYVHRVMTEFWTTGGAFSPFELEPTVVALRKAGKNIVEAEAMTGQPAFSRWTETPAWLKPVGDGAFCAGVNRFVLHRFVHQPWDDSYRPGATFGHWGTHFDRTQTWWEPFKAMVGYWQRCQALLQWGEFCGPERDFTVVDGSDVMRLGHIHRRGATTDIYFVANTARKRGRATCRFGVTGRLPELWNPVTGSMRSLPEFTDDGTAISIPLKFDDAESFFVVFREKTFPRNGIVTRNVPAYEEISQIDGPWRVTFDSAWGGPAKPVEIKELDDWTERAEPGIRYYSGTAVYRTTFDAPPGKQSDLYLDLGVVRHIARVRLNGNDLGVIWTAPWHVNFPRSLLVKKDNRLEIEVTNVWANRLVGDEQEPPDAEWAPGHIEGKTGMYMTKFPDWFVKNGPRPSKGRYCFTTWNYFTRDEPLVKSGLLGPVTLQAAIPEANMNDVAPGPFKATSWLSSTARGNHVYLQLDALPKEELHLPSIPDRHVKSARVQDGVRLRMKSERGRLVVGLPPGSIDEGDVVVLTLDRSAEGIVPLEVQSHVLREAAKLSVPPSPTYAGRGAGSLVDKVRGTVTPSSDGAWLGFEKDDCEAVIDLHSSMPMSRVVVGSLQAQGVWIFLPRAIEVSVSVDGTAFTPAGRIDLGEPKNDETAVRKELEVPLSSVTARFVKVRVSNVGVCPAWHKGAGGKAWVFLDEIMIEP